MTDVVFNHHVRCVEQNERVRRGLDPRGFDPEDPLPEYDCICGSLPTTEELNEALELVPR